MVCLKDAFFGRVKLKKDLARTRSPRLKIQSEIYGLFLVLYFVLKVISKLSVMSFFTQESLSDKKALAFLFSQGAHIFLDRASGPDRAQPSKISFQ